MVWKSDGVLMKSPSTYKDSIEDTDNDSYTSAEDGSLIDNTIAVGMVKADFSYDYLTEKEAEDILQETYKNPMNITLKCPSVKGGILTAPFRCSKRSSEMIDTKENEDPNNSHWKISFSIMQKELVDSQKG
ncbi:MAG: hypothetical protein ACI4ON_00525 [Clostridia bacterium]